MAINKFVSITFDDSDPILAYSIIEHLDIPDEDLFNVFLMENRNTPYGFIGAIVGLDTAKFIAEQYHTKYNLQSAIVSEKDNKTQYWPVV